MIRVEDEGAGFDPAQVQDPLAPENLLKPNGRGIFYMKSFMDDIQYGSRPGGGTIVTLRKTARRPARRGSDAGSNEEGNHRMKITSGSATT